MNSTSIIRCDRILSRSFTSVLLPSNAMPSAHLSKTLLLRHATNSSISHQWIITPSPASCRTTLFFPSHSKTTILARVAAKSPSRNPGATTQSLLPSQLCLFNAGLKMSTHYSISSSLFPAMDTFHVGTTYRQRLIGTVCGL